MMFLFFSKIHIQLLILNINNLSLVNTVLDWSQWGYGSLYSQFWSVILKWIVVMHSEHASSLLMHWFFFKVRFACGEALAKVRNMCVWDFAHRAARIGPWEQAARDRARFSSRILSLSSVLNPILDPCHRSKIYNARFAPTWAKKKKCPNLRLKLTVIYF